MSIRDLLGMDLPIIQAPMAGVQGSALAVAVSRAGGLGSLPCAMLSADTLRKELEAIKTQTDKPFNVNFFCHRPPTADAARGEAWMDLFRAYYAEWGLTPSTASGPGRMPFDHDMARLVLEFKPAVISFHFGLPSPELLDMALDADCLISIDTDSHSPGHLEFLNYGCDKAVAHGIDPARIINTWPAEDLLAWTGEHRAA